MPILDELWASLDHRNRRALEPDLRAALRREPDALPRLYLAPKVHQWKRNLLHGILREYLKTDRATARKSIAAIVEARPEDESMQRLAIAADLLPVEQLRALVATPRQTMRGRMALFALVRNDDMDWIAAQARAGSLPDHARALLPQVATHYDHMARRVVHLVAECEDRVMLAAVLSHLHVADDVLRLAHRLSHTSPALLAALMPHAQRLKKTRAVLKGGLTHPEVVVRRAALQALQTHPDPKLLPAVRALLDDPDEYNERYNPRPVGWLVRDILRKAGERV